EVLIIQFVCFFRFVLRLRPRRSTLFPYTTLFRSEAARRRWTTPDRHPPVAAGPANALDLNICPTTLGNLSLCDSDRPLFGQMLRSEEHTSELQSLAYLVCRLLLEKKKHNIKEVYH